MRYELLNSVLFLTIAVNIAGCTLSPQFLRTADSSIAPLSWGAPQSGEGYRGGVAGRRVWAWDKL